MKKSRNVTCVFCDKQIKVQPRYVSKHEISMDNGELYLTLFRCPACGNADVKSVDDIESKQYLERVFYYEHKRLKLSKQGRCLVGSDKKQMAIAENKLYHRRQMLLKQYQEQVYQFVVKLDTDQDEHLEEGENDE